MEPAPATPRRRSDLKVALACVAFFATMFGAAFAAVPLYDWFCRVTGIGGTTQVATRAPDQVLERTITVRFDANVSGGLPWRFEPLQTTMTVRLGEPVLAHYRVTNLSSSRETVGTASYNVTPLTTGVFFHKMACFCFTEQFLAPGETQDFTVSFFVDPDLDKDHGSKSLDTITLSYTFFPTRNPSRPLAQAPTATVGAVQ
jgi:cytochrome c oxidase assembly protein subunit 11